MNSDYEGHDDENENNDNDDPTCNINNGAGLVVALCIGCSARHLFSCVAPMVIMIMIIIIIMIAWPSWPGPKLDHFILLTLSSPTVC